MAGVLRLELHQHWRLNRSLTSLNSRPSTYNFFAFFLLFNVLEIITETEDCYGVQIPGRGEELSGLAGYFAWVGRIWVAFVSLSRRAAGWADQPGWQAVGNRESEARPTACAVFRCVY